MTDTITIPPGPHQAMLVAFVGASALLDCTTLHVAEDTGHATLRPVRPLATLSTGEFALWMLLSSLVHGPLAHAADRLDTENRAAVVAVIGAVFGAG